MVGRRKGGGLTAAAFALAVVLGSGAAGCTHFAQVVDRAPVTVSLRSYRTAAVQVVAGPLDADDASDLVEDLTEKIKDAKVFGSVLPPGSAAEMLVRITVLGETDAGSVEVRLLVEMIDVRAAKVVGSYAVTADSRADVDLGGGNFDLESKTSKALAKASGAIVDHLGEVAR